MAASDSRPVPIYGQAFCFQFDVLDDDGVGVTGLTSPAPLVSIDNRAFAAADNAAALIGDGVCHITLSATEMTARIVAFKLACSEGRTWQSISIAPAQPADIRVNLVSILGTLLTETVGGYLAAAFKKVFDVVTPVFTAASVNQTGDVGVAGAGLTAIGDARLANLDATITSRLAAAGYTTPPTAAANASQVRSELSVELARIDAAVSSRATADAVAALPSIADVNAQCDQALDDYDGPTSAELDARTLLASEYGTAVALGLTDAKVDAIKLKTDNLPTDPADASEIETSFSTLNTTLGMIAGYVDTEVAAIKEKTDQMTFTVANRLDSTTQGGLSTLDAAGVRAAVGLAEPDLDTQLDALAEASDLDDAIETIDQIEADTELLRSVVAGVRSSADGKLTTKKRDGTTNHAQLTQGSTPGSITAVELL